MGCARGSKKRGEGKEVAGAWGSVRDKSEYFGDETLLDARVLDHRAGQSVSQGSEKLTK